MKTILQLIIISSLLFGCGGVNSKMNKTLDKVYPGMTIAEFKKTVKNEILVQMLENYCCYKIEVQRAKFGQEGGYRYATRFFYFKDNILYKIDEGERATDLKIEIQNN